MRSCVQKSTIHKQIEIFKTISMNCSDINLRREMIEIYNVEKDEQHSVYSIYITKLQLDYNMETFNNHFIIPYRNCVLMGCCF